MSELDHRRAARRGPGARRLAWTSALLLPWLAGCGGEAAPRDEGTHEPSARDSRPSLIVILIDTLRRDHLELYGYDKPTSPELSRLARESWVFEHCYSPSSWTKPSTVSLLTGLYPARHGAHDKDSEAPEELTFLAEVLSEEGYACWGVSGNPNASPTFGMSQGFERFHFSRNSFAREYPDIRELLGSARDWMQEERERPLFLYLHVMNVHGPYLAPDGYLERFAEQPLQPFEFRSQLWLDIMKRDKRERRADFQQGHLNELRARYDAAIAYTDEQLGDFLDELRASGVLDESYLIVTSDHGEELFEHQGFGHGFTLYDEVLRVPLLIRPPGGLEQESRQTAPVGLIDISPTVLELLGLASDERRATFADGRSFAPLLRGEAAPEERVLLGQVHREQQGMLFGLRKGPYVLLQIEEDYNGRRDVVELFDTSADPGQLRDLSGERADEAREFTELMMQLRARLEEAAFEPGAVELDAETLRRLEALGYAK